MTIISKKSRIHGELEEKYTQARKNHWDSVLMNNFKAYPLQKGSF
jgi:hypothetical protein